MQDIQCQLTVSRGQFLADKRPLKKLTNFGFFFATLHFSTRSIKWTYLEEILAKFAYPIAIRVKNKTYMTERIRKARSPYFVQYYPNKYLL